MEKYYKESSVNHLIDYEIKYSSRMFRFIITDDNDDSYVPKLKSDFILCDCSNGEDFTRGITWKKYFDEFNNEPVVFINTSAMFQQFENRAIESGRDNGRKGAGLWARYFYEQFRDKMWREQRTKFLFIIKEEDMEAMCKAVDGGFIVELRNYYMQKEDSKKINEEQKNIKTKKLALNELNKENK